MISCPLSSFVFVLQIMKALDKSYLNIECCQRVNFGKKET